MDAPTPAFAKAPGNHSDIVGIVDEHERILEQLRTEQGETRRSARQNDMEALPARQQQTIDTGPIQVLIQQTGGHEPFGCPDYR